MKKKKVVKWKKIFQKKSFISGSAHFTKSASIDRICFDSQDLPRFTESANNNNNLHWWNTGTTIDGTTWMCWLKWISNFIRSLWFEIFHLQSNKIDETYNKATEIATSNNSETEWIILMYSISYNFQGQIEAIRICCFQQVYCIDSLTIG